MFIQACRTGIFEFLKYTFSSSCVTEQFLSFLASFVVFLWSFLLLRYCIILPFKYIIRWFRHEKQNKALY